jgi:hypothetical protein
LSEQGPEPGSDLWMAERIAEWAKRPLPDVYVDDNNYEYRVWLAALVETCKYPLAAKRQITRSLNHPHISIVPILEEYLFTKVD